MLCVVVGLYKLLFLWGGWCKYCIVMRGVYMNEMDLREVYVIDICIIMVIRDSIICILDFMIFELRWYLLFFMEFYSFNNIL